MSTDNRDPVSCGYSIGFDGVFVCRLELLPCAAAQKCPVETDYLPLDDYITQKEKEALGE